MFTKYALNADISLHKDYCTLESDHVFVWQKVQGKFMALYIDATKSNRSQVLFFDKKEELFGYLAAVEIIGYEFGDVNGNLYEEFRAWQAHRPKQ